MPESNATPGDLQFRFEKALLHRVLKTPILGGAGFWVAQRFNAAVSSFFSVGL
jgi:hypothetical protein